MWSSTLHVVFQSFIWKVRALSVRQGLVCLLTCLVQSLHLEPLLRILDHPGGRPCPFAVPPKCVAHKCVAYMNKYITVLIKHSQIMRRLGVQVVYIIQVALAERESESRAEVLLEPSLRKTMRGSRAVHL